MTDATGDMVTESEMLMTENEVIKAIQALDIDMAQLNGLAGLFPKADRLIAQHPNADENLLQRLAGSKDRKTRQFVSMNPRTPKDELLTLASEFPASFCGNPAFDWLLIENPDLLFGLKPGFLKNILKLDDCPRSFQNWAVKNGNKSEQMAVVMRPDVTVEMLHKIANSPHVRAAEAASGKLLAMGGN